jgi:tetratricopeptide (TPR) repeat protein
MNREGIQLEKVRGCVDGVKDSKEPTAETPRTQRLRIEEPDWKVRTIRVVLSLVLICLWCAGDRYGQGLAGGTGAQLLAHGDYTGAIKEFEAALAKDAGDRAARDGLLSAEIETGQYKEAEAKIREYLKSGGDAPLLNTLGNLLTEVGRYQESAAAFGRASEGSSGKDLLRSILGSSRALLAMGKDEDAHKQLNRMGDYAGSNGARSAEELTLLADGLVILEKFQEANEFYIDARQADPGYAQAFVRQGEMYNLKYRYGDAASLFADALKINRNSVRARLGLAESKEVSSSGEADAEIQRALTVNPNSAHGLAMKARLELEGERVDTAKALLDRALAVNPNLIEALAVKAAAAYLANNPAEVDALTKQALAANPRAATFFDILAHFAIQNRRYADAVAFERRALELEPRLWSARTELGIELLRTGNEKEGRDELEKAFAGDPFNIWAKNTLDLLDSMRDYRETNREPFLIKCAPQDSGAVSAYAGALLEEALKKLSEKYHFMPQGPIVVEIFPNHEDFAVRSLGLPGLGALGVCFGKVIAMDSPSAREAGHFNWGSTLWHEFTHVITLQMTDYRIPRWFSEGLSVYEERKARPEWGEKWSIDLVKAFYGGRFVGIGDMDAAFTRPKSPDQIPLAYFQASLICDFVEEKLGFGAILKMLDLYKHGAKTPDVLKEALGIDAKAFDQGFLDYVRGKTAGYQSALSGRPRVESRSGSKQEQQAVLEAGQSKEALLARVATNQNDYFARLSLGAIYKKEGSLEQAIEQFSRAAAAFPYYGGEGNPYIELADIYKAKGQKQEEAVQLEALGRVDETEVEPLKRLATLRLGMGDKAAGLKALTASFYIYPFDAALHKLAGDVYLEQGSTLDAINEFSAVLGMKPADPAGAHYDLARAMLAGGNRAAARQEVLRALEIAPEFEKAQELLLKIRAEC